MKGRSLDREIDGRELTFVLTDEDQLRDLETGSLWGPTQRQGDLRRAGAAKS